MNFVCLCLLASVCARTCGFYTEEDVAIGIWSHEGDKPKALCQRETFLHQFSHSLIVSDEEDRLSGIRRASAAMPPTRRNYGTAMRKQFLLFFDLFDQYPNKNFYVVLDTDAVVFQDVLLLELNQQCARQEQFVGGYVNAGLLWGGFMVATGGAIANLTMHRNFLGCKNALEGIYRTNWPIWSHRRAFVAGDHYVTYCAHTYEYGPQVPIVSFRGSDWGPCTNRSDDSTLWLSCHHVRGCQNLSTVYARGVQRNKMHSIPF